VGRPLEIEARRLVLAAGAGNRQLLARLGWRAPVMQLRPLHMLMLRGSLPTLYGHCLGTGPNPRLTVTSYRAAAGDRIWYLGGQVAETGVERSPSAQIAAGRAELAELLPWLDLGDTRWASLRVERAEPWQPRGRRPEGIFLGEREGVLVAWPTKLALAPCLASEVMAKLSRAGIEPHPGYLDPLQDLPPTQLSEVPWEDGGVWI
jgi:glycine/D-amino acid oxidase-like deaminating enzyme